MNINLAKTMLIDLTYYYNLSDWRCGFDRSLTRLGYCNYSRKLISLSKHATEVNTSDTVLNTILHEIAHALVGPGVGHGLIWQAKAVELGCDAKRVGKLVIQAPGRYAVKCTTCDWTKTYYRKPKWINYIDRIWCNACGPAISRGKIMVEKR